MPGPRWPSPPRQEELSCDQRHLAVSGPCPARARARIVVLVPRSRRRACRRGRAVTDRRQVHRTCLRHTPHGPVTGTVHRTGLARRRSLRCPPADAGSACSGSRGDPVVVRQPDTFTRAPHRAPRDDEPSQKTRPGIRPPARGGETCRGVLAAAPSCCTQRFSVILDDGPTVIVVRHLVAEEPLQGPQRRRGSHGSSRRLAVPACPATRTTAPHPPFKPPGRGFR